MVIKFLFSGLNRPPAQNYNKKIGPASYNADPIFYYPGLFPPAVFYNPDRLYKLDQNFHSSIAFTLSDLDDSCITAVAVSVLRSDL